MLMALVEVYSGQRRLAFELNTAASCIEILNMCARCHGKYGRLCETVIYMWLTLTVKQNSFILFFELVVAECFQKEDQTGSISISISKICSRK